MVDGGDVRRVRHPLRTGGADTLDILRYSDTNTRKMGWWGKVTFKEYIRKEVWHAI